MRLSRPSEGHARSGRELKRRHPAAGGGGRLKRARPRRLRPAGFELRQLSDRPAGRNALAESSPRGDQ
jgi:hypothetical protein